MCGSFSVIVIGCVFSFLPFLQFIIHIVIIHFMMIIITFRIIKIITVKCHSLQTHVNIILRFTILLFLILIIITFITFIAKVVTTVII